MLTEGEIKRYAHLRRLRLIDQIWKDYLQDILLHLLYRKMPDMVFSGGTCIWKVLKGDRFSEDIDAFMASIPPDLTEYLKKELSLLGVSCNVLKKKKTQNMLFLKLELSFPSHPRNIFLSAEILSGQQKEKEAFTLFSPYPDIPPVDMVILSPKALLIDKVSAIFERSKPRDIHDLYLLLKRGTEINMDAIYKKMPGFTIEGFRKKILEKQPLWKSLEPLIVTKLPPLKEEADFILSLFQKAITR